MATAANPLADNMGLLNSLVGTLFGKSSTQTDTKSGGTTTQTSQTQMSQEAVNSLLKGLMEGTSGRPGLAAISAGQKAPGLYNTSSRSLLVNDLLARSAAQVAEASSAKTVTTTAPQQTTRSVMQAPGVGSNGLLSMAAVALGSKSGRKFLEDEWDSVSKLFGGADVGNNIPLGFADSMTGIQSSFGAADGFSGLGQSVGSSGFDVSSLGLANIGSGSSSGLDFLSSFDFGGAVDSWGGIADSSGAIFNSGNYITDMALADYADFGSAGVSSLEGGLSWLDGGGGFDFGLSGVGQVAKALSGDVEGALGSYALYSIPVAGPIIAGIDALTGSGIGSAIGGAVGDVVGGIGDAIGGIFEGITGGCFITTAACKYAQLEDDSHELNTLRQFRDSWLAENHPGDIDTYYAEAPKIVARLEAREDAETIFSAFYFEYILPAVVAIEDGAYHSAYAIYRSLFHLAKELADEIEPVGV